MKKILIPAIAALLLNYLPMDSFGAIDASKLKAKYGKTSSQANTQTIEHRQSSTPTQTHAKDTSAHANQPQEVKKTQINTKGITNPPLPPINDTSNKQYQTPGQPLAQPIVNIEETITYDDYKNDMPQIDLFPLQAQKKYEFKGIYLLPKDSVLIRKIYATQDSAKKDSLAAIIQKEDTGKTVGISDSLKKDSLQNKNPDELTINIDSVDALIKREGDMMEKMFWGVSKGEIEKNTGANGEVTINIKDIEAYTQGNETYTKVWEKFKDKLIKVSASLPKTKTEIIGLPTQITFDTYGALEPCIDDNGAKIAYRQLKRNKSVVLVQLDGKFKRAYRGGSTKNIKLQDEQLIYDFEDDDGLRKIMVITPGTKPEERVLMSNVSDLSSPGATKGTNNSTVFAKDNNIFAYLIDSKETIPISVNMRNQRKPITLENTVKKTDSNGTSSVTTESVTFFISDFESRNGENIYVRTNDGKKPAGEPVLFTNLTDNNQRILDYDANNKYLVYTALRTDNTSEFCVIDLDKKIKYVLGTDGDFVHSVSISNNNMLAFTTGRFRSKESTVNLLNLDNQQMLKVAKGYFPKISKNGSKITYTAEDNNQTRQVFVYTVPKDFSIFPQTISSEHRVQEYLAQWDNSHGKKHKRK